jgi:hypothetical protein
MEQNQFEAKKAEGEWFEKIIDKFYSRRFGVSLMPVSMELQMLGIDRIVTDPETGERWSLEIKTDFRASQTGNFFIEICTNDITGRKGWAWTSCAQELALFVPDMHTLFITEMRNIKKILPDWLTRFQTKTANNGNHCSKGVIVSIEAFIRDCKPKQFYVEF